VSIINDQSVIGLANRFKVKVIPGGYDLGSWQKCEGLDVTWDMPEYRGGDMGNFRVFFPGNTKYSTVKLMRAASASDTPTVQKWLEKNQFHYTDSRATAIDVTLCDSAGSPIHVWALRNAQPKKWSVNSMDAGASQVSIETLELEHEGFLENDRMP
jgi:phage tail-like protein